MASEIALGLHLEDTHLPAVLDLEGTVPLDILLQVKRGATDISRQMNIRTDGSLFDIPYAFSKGLFKLVDLKTGENVDLDIPVESPEPKFITIPARVGRLPRFECDLTIPLLLSTHVKSALVPKHRYSVKLNTVDLGVKWWNYATEDGDELKQRALDDRLPRSEPARLIANGPHHRDFRVVESLPKPPKVSISLSLTSAEVIHRSNPHPLALRATIINTGNSAITVQSTRDQIYISDNDDPRSNIPNHRRITSTEQAPSVQSFSIIENATGNDLMNPAEHSCSLRVGSGEGTSRKGLTVLEPNVPLVNDFVLMENPWRYVRLANSETKDFTLKLRTQGVRWFAGTVDDVFGAKKVVKDLPGPCLPLMLECDDEVHFRMEE